MNLKTIFKSAAAVLAAASIATTFSACAMQKTATDEDTFKNKMEDLKLEIVDIKEDCPEELNATVALVAGESKVNRYEFYEFDDEDAAKSAYASLETSFAFEYDKAGNEGNYVKSSNSSSGINYDSATYSYSGIYCTFTRVDNTLLLVFVDDEHKDEAKELLKSLEY